jgi:predicted MFS family arabinose efflux permease
VSFAWSAAWLSTLPPLPPLAAAATATGGAPLAGAMRAVSAGMHFVRSDDRVRSALACVLCACAGLGVWLATFAVVARDRWSLGARGTGILISIFGAGAIAGAALAVPLARRCGPAAVVRGALLLVATALAAFAAAGSRGAGAMATLALGASAALVLVPAAALVQAASPPALLGRVQAAAIAAVGLVQAAAVAAAGVATRVAPTAPALAAAAAGVAAAGLTAWLFAYRARRSAAGDRETCGSPSR